MGVRGDVGAGMLEDFACSALPLRECQVVPSCSLPFLQLAVLRHCVVGRWWVGVRRVVVGERAPQVVSLDH